MKLVILSRLAGLLVVIHVFLSAPTPLFSEETQKIVGTISADSKSTMEAEKAKKDEKKQAVKNLEKQAEEVKQVIQSKEGSVQEAKKEAEKVAQEKETLKQEVELKKQAAVLVKEELKAVQEEAKVTKDPRAAKKADQLQEKVEQLDKETEAKKSRLSILESQAQLAEEIATSNEKAIAALQAELKNIGLQKAGKRGLIEKLLDSVIFIVIGLALFFLLMLGARKFENLISEKDAIRESERTLRLKTVSALFRWVSALIVFGFIAYSVLETFGINMAPLLAGAGIAGLAFGFGGQYLIRDIINGVFILLESQYRINDVVKIGELAGLVEGVNLRVTRLRDLEGRVIYIPNGEIKSVINFTKEYSQALLDIGVAYKENVDRVMEIMKQVAQEMRKDSYFGKVILADMEMLGVNEFSDSAVMIKCRMKTLPIKQWEVSREYRRRLKNRFDELGIEIPFPHRTLYWGAGEENNWMKERAKQK